MADAVKHLKEVSLLILCMHNNEAKVVKKSKTIIYSIAQLLNAKQQHNMEVQFFPKLDKFCNKFFPVDHCYMYFLVRLILFF